MASRKRPLSRQAKAVLEFLHHHPSQWRYGYELMRALNLKSGTLYPLLKRLRERDLLDDQWEPFQGRGRPARRVHRLSTRGVSRAKELAGAKANCGN
jgi:DNA-binding PadR family transcriptional regulator